MIGNEFTHEEVVIDVSENPLICNCEMVELAALSLWKTQYLNSSVIIAPCYSAVGSNSTDILPDVKICPKLETITTAKLCLGHLKYEKCNYPKFSIKLDQNFIVIRTQQVDRYKVWTYSFTDASHYNSKWGYSQKKCPSRGFLERSTRCLIVNGKIAWRTSENVLAIALYMADSQLKQSLCYSSVPFWHQSALWVS